MLEEFRKFVMRGNVLDLAVGVIIGGAFGAIIGSLVNDILMPLIGVLLGGINFAGQAIQVGSASIGWGNFVQAVINFLIIAFVIFQIVQVANRVNPPQPPAPAGPTPDQKLLGEIRDLLAKR